MNTILHVLALAPAALGAGVLCATRRGTGAPERAAAVLMVGAMTDAMTVSLVSPVVWFAVLILAAVVLAAVRRAPLPATGGPATRTGLSTHLALGLVVTATLIVLMPSGSVVAELSSTSPSHAHGGDAGLLTFVCATLVIGTAAAAATAVRADRSWRHRLHHVAMSGSTIAMAAAVLA
ncbi:MAG: hypothetical protein ACQEW8_07820 [Actinomycetota bacterium]